MSPTCYLTAPPRCTHQPRGTPVMMVISLLRLPVFAVTELLFPFPFKVSPPLGWWTEVSRFEAGSGDIPPARGPVARFVPYPSPVRSSSPALEKHPDDDEKVDSTQRDGGSRHQNLASVHVCHLLHRRYPLLQVRMR